MYNSNNSSYFNKKALNLRKLFHISSKDGFMVKEKDKSDNLLQKQAYMREK